MPEDHSKDGGKDPGKPDSPGNGAFDWKAWLQAQPDPVREKFEGIDMDKGPEGLLSTLAKYKKEREDALAAEAARKAAEEAAQKQREQDLLKQQEFEKLASERGARLETLEKELGELQARHAALEQKAGAVDAMEKALERQYTALTESMKIPDSVSGLLRDKPVLERLKWVTDHQQDFEKKKPEQIPETPDADADDQDVDEEARRKATVSVMDLLR